MLMHRLHVKDGYEEEVWVCLHTSRCRWFSFWVTGSLCIVGGRVGVIHHCDTVSLLPAWLCLRCWSVRFRIAPGVLLYSGSFLFLNRWNVSHRHNITLSHPRMGWIHVFHIIFVFLVLFQHGGRYNNENIIFSFWTGHELPATSYKLYQRSIVPAVSDVNAADCFNKNL